MKNFIIFLALFSYSYLIHAQLNLIEDYSNYSHQILNGVQDLDLGDSYANCAPKVFIDKIKKINYVSSDEYIAVDVYGKYRKTWMILDVDNNSKDDVQKIIRLLNSKQQFLFVGMMCGSAQNINITTIMKIDAIDK